jgi:hypothetical protein
VVDQEQKFKDKKLNCLEIDLSELAWNSTYDQIRECVLNSEQGHWVNYYLSGNDESIQ